MADSASQYGIWTESKKYLRAHPYATDEQVAIHGCGLSERIISMPNSRELATIREARKDLKACQEQEAAK